MILNDTQNTMIAETVYIADHFFRRLKGLLGTNSLPTGHALIIRPCNSVHTFGMRYPIDVLFLDKNNCVIKVVQGMKPGKLAWSTGSFYTVELPEDTILATKTKIGDKIILQP